MYSEKKNRLLATWSTRLRAFLGKQDKAKLQNFKIFSSTSGQREETLESKMGS